VVKIVKNPGNGRLNNLNDPVLNVLRWTLKKYMFACVNSIHDGSHCGAVV